VTSAGQVPVVLRAGPGHIGELLDRVSGLREAAHASARRVLIGVTGAPGAGKSTLTEELAGALGARGLPTAVVGMDGFHLAQRELRRLGREHRKGAPDTFDAHGYVALLHRLRRRPGHTGPGHTVYAPRYVRGGLEEPIGSAVPVHPHVQVVLTEGNYLLLPQEPWDQVPPVLDEVWYVQPDDTLRRQRLLGRHVAAGKSHAEALAFTDGSDAANAELVTATRHRADVLIEWH